MRLLLILAFSVALGAQRGGPGRHSPTDPDQPDTRLPSGKSQRQEILKADHKKSMAEAAELVTLAQQLQQDLEKSEHQVLNLKLVKKAEEIEKLARAIKNRMRRY